MGGANVELLCSGFGPDLRCSGIGHLIRIMRGWAVHIGPYSVPMSLSWIGLAIAAVLAIWGFMQLG
jgi:hypothetical protein